MKLASTIISALGFALFLAGAAVALLFTVRVVWVPFNEGLPIVWPVGDYSATYALALLLSGLFVFAAGRALCASAPDETGYLTFKAGKFWVTRKNGDAGPYTADELALAVLTKRVYLPPKRGSVPEPRPAAAIESRPLRTVSDDA